MNVNLVRKTEQNNEYEFLVNPMIVPAKCDHFLLAKIDILLASDSIDRSILLNWT